MCRFLRFTVEQTIAGRAADLKEFAIGAEVFDRRQEYDPRIDPIVRVEARRLRTKLLAYYKGEGRQDPIVIELPKGSYAPMFHDRASLPGPQAATGQAATGGIAVLPLANLSSDTDTEYFGDGLTQELIHNLTKVEGLRVVAWHSAEQLRAHTADFATVGERLGVETVLTGSVRTAGTRVRITVQLVSAADGRYLWSEIYDRKLDDLFTIQEEISRAVVSRLTPKLASSRPVNIHGGEAYAWYLKGRYHWTRRTAEGLRKSLDCFRSALVLQPDMALAHAGVADALTLLVDYGLEPADAVMPEADRAVRQALAIDPTLAEAETSLAMIESFWRRNWRKAEEHYLRAISLNPGYVTAHHWYAVDFCALMGNFDQAEEELSQACRLDPISPIIREGLAFVQLMRRDYAGGLEIYRSTLELDPYFYKGYTGTGRAYALMGRYAEALAALEKGRELAGNIPNIVAAIGQVNAAAGRPEIARAQLRLLEDLSRDGHVPLTSFAIVHQGLGEKETALDYLEKAIERCEFSIYPLGVHPIYDSLRSEPRFHTLVSRLGLS